MAESEKLRREINPCVLHLQKLGLELKCPICLTLLRRPILLPCNHILCSSCVPEFGSSCLVCKAPFLHQDLRSAPQMETIISIYRSMNAAFGAHHFHSVPQVGLSDITEKSRVERMHNSQTETSNIVPPSIPSVQGDKRVQASIHHIKSGIEIPERSAKYCKLRDESESHQRERSFVQNCFNSSNAEAFVSEVNPSWSPFSSLMDPKHKKDVAHQRHANQCAPTSPGSPPSFGDMKDSDDDNNDRGNEHLSAETLSMKDMGVKEPDVGTNSEAKVVLPSPKTAHFISRPEVSEKLNAVGNSDPTSPAKDEYVRESKRQKNSNSECHDAPSDASKYMNPNLPFVCAFCQTSEESEASGPMLHYTNGRALAADQAVQANVLHVHRKCIEWAPQAYFVGETVVNLEAELARGAKIKCNSCGKKGAALGCFAKSCRKSFHVPCAVNILDCRWDCDNFLMLCPAHLSLKLPCEKSKFGKIRTNHSSETQPTNLQKVADPRSSMSESNKLWAASSAATCKWVLCGSALSSMEKDFLAEFVSLTGATVTKVWKPNVTHVIASTNDMGACSRTLKFLMGVLNGKWILKIDWIKACMEAKHPVGEEPYEVSLDIHGCCDAPKNGRIRVLEKAPKLFSGLNFYFSGDFVSPYKGYLTDLVFAAGGNVRFKKDMVSMGSETDTDVSHSSNLLIYRADVCESGEESSIIEQRCQVAEAFAAETGSRVAPHTWLLESIAACKLQPLPF